MVNRIHHSQSFSMFYGLEGELNDVLKGVCLTGSSLSFFALMEFCFGSYDLSY